MKDAGFYFTRFFSRLSGIAPRTFRRQGADSPLGGQK
jgi:hypothetical protein